MRMRNALLRYQCGYGQLRCAYTVFAAHAHRRRGLGLTPGHPG
jgi:hypothetical protein